MRVDDAPRAHLEQHLIQQLESESNISQRALARALGVAVGTINRLLNDMMVAGYVRVSNRSVRPFAYKVTDDGRRYQRRLSHEQYTWILARLQRLEQRIRSTLAGLRSRGVNRVVFYGAGDVMEATHGIAEGLGLKVVGVVDDDVTKQGLRKGQLVVEPPSAISQLRPDAVLITTLRHADEIRSKFEYSLGAAVEIWEL